MKDKSLCFVFNQTKTYFTSAEESCMDLGGHLASIHYSIDNLLIAQQAANKFTDSKVKDFWVGANDFDAKGTWAWMDGTPFNYSDWNKGQPKNNTNSHCGAIKIPNGIWISDDCSTKTKPFVCSVRTLAETTTTKATAPTKPMSCLDGWTYNNATKYCYKVMIQLNWLDAEDMCKVDGAHLTSIHSLDEALWVANLAIFPGAVNNSMRTAQAWIGLHTDDTNFPWKWTDGTPVDYIKWWSEAPHYNLGSQRVAFIYLSPPYHGNTGDFDTFTYDTVMARSICKMLPS